MKKILLTGLVLSAATLAQAQDTYLNDQLVNNSGDTYGTARYVGMGGAMGALGADLSTMGLNPAGIGLMRKSDVAITAGAIWDKSCVANASRAHATLDQAGFVYAIPLYGSSALRNVNIGFNYQKKKNFGNAFTASQDNLNGLSQMTELAELKNANLDTDYNLQGLATDKGYLTSVGSAYTNAYPGVSNKYYQRSWGSLNGFDINVSGNVNDRGYWGITFGIDNLRYRSVTQYCEYSAVNTTLNRAGNYALNNDVAIDGWGFNIKMGGIVRPIEDNSLRIGFTVETPTWYQTRNSTIFNLCDLVDGSYTPNWYNYPNNYNSLESSIRTPWKLRASIGQTIGNYLAWDVEYEWANYAKTKTGYPNNDTDGPHSSLFSNTWDRTMNQQTQDNLKSVHTIKAGVEYRPISAFAIRIGYNYATSAYKNNPTYNQYALGVGDGTSGQYSDAMKYTPSTSYMKMGDINIVTFGLGYKWRHAYIDIAYKLRAQKADFYAFYESGDANNKAVTTTNVLTPVKDVDLTRHQITATLGFKF